MPVIAATFASPPRRAMMTPAGFLMNDSFPWE
jgi:hypothetical protein